jgi:hypothetical protein
MKHLLHIREVPGLIYDLTQRILISLSLRWISNLKLCFSSFRGVMVSVDPRIAGSNPEEGDDFLR